MRMRPLRLMCSILVLLLMGSVLQARKPNIIFILADDLGYSEVGAYGQKWIKTPNVDRIARDGMKFTQFYAGSPVCAPSRCVLMTGKHTGHAYTRNNGYPRHRKKDADKGLFPGQHPIPDSEVTIAELLKAQGYATCGTGKWGLGYEGSTGDPNKQGFDLFYGFYCQWHAHNHYPRFLLRNGEKEVLPGNDRTLYGKTYSQDRFVDVTCEFIRETVKKDKDQPFFAYMPFAVPHLSIQVPDDSLKQYKGKIPEAEYVHRGYLEHPHPRAGYAAMVTHMDKGIGQVMDLVKELGIDDDTIILFSSDNGPTFKRLGGADSDFFESAGPLRGRKGSVLEGGLRVPLVARWPGKVKAGAVSDHVAAFWDLMATFVEIAGAKDTVPADTDGISFAPTLMGKGKQKSHEYLYWEFAAYGGQQAVRMGDWKAVRQNMMKGKGELELYNLAADISESKNVVGNHPDVAARIKKIMREARQPSKLFRFKALDG